MNVFFRDTAQIIAALLTIWMFMTPLFYPIDLIPERFLTLYMANPMAHLVLIYRDIFINERMFGLGGFLYFSGISLAIFFAGYNIFTKNHRKFVDHL